MDDRLKSCVARIARAARDPRLSAELRSLIGERGELARYAPALANLLSEAEALAKYCGQPPVGSDSGAAKNVQHALQSTRERELDFSTKEKSRSSIEALKSMTAAERVEIFAERLRETEPSDDAQKKVYAELTSKELGLRKDEIVSLARSLLGKSYGTKKEALRAIERWLWHRARSSEEGQQIRNSLAS